MAEFTFCCQNFDAEGGGWNDVKTGRKMTSGKGVQPQPGCS